MLGHGASPAAPQSPVNHLADLIKIDQVPHGELGDTPRMSRHLRKAREIEPGDWGPRVGKARVLVENPDRAELWAFADLLQKAGYDVATCSGPAHADGEHTRCPLVERDVCPLVEGADVVVSTSTLADGREILAALGERSSPRVLFEAPAPAFDRYEEVGGAARLIACPVMEQSLLEAVAEEAST